MPGLGRTDPADLRAHARAQLGLTRLLQQAERIPPHPSRGGCGYPVFHRGQQIALWQAGEPINVSVSSIRNWQRRLVPFRRTGNKARAQIVGVDLIHLVTFLRAHPTAHLDEMSIWIYNQGGRLYDRQTVSRRLKDLGISKKKVSTEGYQAQSDDAQFRVHAFFNYPLPLGINQVPRRKFIDVDEFGITLEKCNRTGGWAFKVFRVRTDGHYHHGAKITVLFAIEPGDPRLAPGVRGSVQRPRRWIRCVRNSGTTTFIFRDFFNHICTDIEQNGIPGTDDHRIFMWDNLQAHHSAYVHQTVTGRAGPRRFSIAARPPYHPKYGPIEYKICEVTDILQKRKQPDWTMRRLEREIVRAAHSIRTFDSTFDRCGFRWA